MATVVDTSTAATATAYSNQRKAARTSNGVLWSIFNNGSSQGELWYSTDNGATWTQDATVLTACNHASLFIDEDDYAHVVHAPGTDTTSSTNHVYYRRGTPNASRTSWTWSSLTLQSGYSAYPDVIAHKEGTGWAAHVVMFTGSNACRYRRVSIDSAGNQTNDGFTDVGTGLASDPSMSIDFNHNGDGKTVAGGTPHLYVAWSANGTGAGKGIRFKKATYSAGSWTWGTEREIDSGRYIVAWNWLNCLFDGTRVIMAGYLYTGTTGNYDVVLYERDAADTTTTTRNLIVTASTAERLNNGSATYDGQGNVYLFGVNVDETEGSRDLVYRKWNRSTATLENEVLIDSSTRVEAYAITKRGYSNGRIEFVYTDGTASPYNVTYDAVVLNTPPNKPPIVSPKDNNTVDRNKTIRLDWEFSDPDTGDSQSKFDARYRVAGTTTWTDITTVTTNTYHDLAAGTLTANDFEWQVRTYDQAGEVSVWSDLAYFTAADAPTGHAITDPVTGQTIGADKYTVHWSASNQIEYELRRVADSAGAPDTTNVLYTTGAIVSSTARSRTLDFPTNNQNEHIQLRYRHTNGLWSTYDSVAVTISYTNASQPIITVAPNDEQGHIAVLIDNPTPAAGEPNINYNDIYRRREGESVWVHRATNIVVDGNWNDHEAASGVVYQYKVTARADNSTSIDSDVQTGSLVVIHWRLKDPYNHTGFVISVEQESLKINTPKDSSFFRPIGRKYRVAVEDVSRGDEFRLTMGVLSEADYTQLRNRLRELRTMLIQPPLYDELWYVRIKPGQSRDVLNTNDPYVKFDVEFVEVDEPNVPR